MKLIDRTKNERNELGNYTVQTALHHFTFIR